MKCHKRCRGMFSCKSLIVRGLWEFLPILPKKPFSFYFMKGAAFAPVARLHPTGYATESPELSDAVYSR